MMLWTVGHSNRPLADFLALLAGNGIERVADVRAFPRSRTNPQFNGDTLPASLTEAGIDRSEEHTSELQSLMRTSYAVLCLKKKNTHTPHIKTTLNQPQSIATSSLHHKIT